MDFSNGDEILACLPYRDDFLADFSSRAGVSPGL